MNDIVRPPEDSGTGISDTSALEAIISNAAHEQSKVAAKAPAVSVPAAPVQPPPAPPAAPVVPVAAAAAPAGVVPDAAAPALAAPAQAEDPAEVRKRKAERDKRLAEAIQRRKSSKTKPLMFVLLTLGAWWALSVLADIVITCVPGGAPCRAPHLVAGGRRLLRAIGDRSYEVTAASTAPTLSPYDWGLLLLGLLAALWVAKAKVYPETDDTGEFTEDELNGKPKPAPEPE